MVSEDRSLALIRSVASSRPQAERTLILNWLKKLADIKGSHLPVPKKAQEAYRATWDSGAIRAIVEFLFKELRRIGWDERSWAGRMAVIGACVGLTFHKRKAGLAAFGRAIAVPLWLVFAVSGAAIGSLIQELEAMQSLQDA